jgi:hypothetical protein
MVLMSGWIAGDTLDRDAVAKKFIIQRQRTPASYNAPVGISKAKAANRTE